MDGKKGGYDSFKGYEGGLSQLEGAVATNGREKQENVFGTGKTGVTLHRQSDKKKSTTRK
jgi:hypothetical protein